MLLQDLRQRGTLEIFLNLEVLLNQTLSKAEKHGVLATAKRYGDQGMGELNFELEPRLYHLKTPTGTLMIPLATGIAVTSEPAS